MKIKICGIIKKEDALLCCDYGADAIGFVFHTASSRHIPFEAAGNIIASLPPFVTAVGVFVNEVIEKINSVAAEIKLGAVQLHGDEDPHNVNRVNLPAIKAFRIKNGFDFDTMNNYTNCYLLLDSYSAGKYGGTGKQFDWNLIPPQFRNKIILSGGISVGDLERIFYELRPAAIDISSLVEKSPGVKDHSKVKELLTNFNKLRGK